jgi:hypothetical protein
MEPRDRWRRVGQFGLQRCLATLESLEPLLEARRAQAVLDGCERRRPGRRRGPGAAREALWVSRSGGAMAQSSIRARIYLWYADLYR